MSRDPHDRTPGTTRRVFRGARLAEAAACAAVAVLILVPLAYNRSHSADDPPPRAAASNPTVPAADASPARDAKPAPGTQVAFDGLALPSSAGVSTALAEACGQSATVLLFVSTECPISNGYVPTVRKLARDLADRGVSVVAIESSPEGSLRDLAAWKREYEFEPIVLKDPAGQVAALVGARTSPEAVVLDAQRRLVYRGRIDDRYARRGGAAQAIRSNDLRDALDAVLAGKPIAKPETEAIGCPLPSRTSRPAPQSAVASNAGVPTYHEHVVPILQQRCQTCHRPQGVGPFALTTYEEAVSWAEDIRRFTADRTMPPWLPVPGHGTFSNERRMTDDEIAVLAQWVEGGCPPGDARRAPPARQFPDGWTLGVPDLVLEPAEEYVLGAEGPDEYRCFVLPTSFAEDRYVSGFEVRPGNAAVVHHVIAFLDAGGKSATLDAKDPGPGYATNNGFPGFFPSGGLGGWAPGNSPRVLPPGTAKLLQKGSAVVIQVHYHRTGKTERDRTRIGLHFAKEPVTRLVRPIPVAPPGGRWSGMRIPAGDANHAVRGDAYLPHDSLLLTITPHMHLLGKDMTVTATRPDGSVERLLRVEHWNFDWQESYQYRSPVPLPKGTRIDLVAHFDNSAANPRNPTLPPRDVGWGEQTTDEMCLAFLELVPQKAAASQADLKQPAPGELLREAIKARIEGKLRDRRKE